MHSLVATLLSIDARGRGREIYYSGKMKLEDTRLGSMYIVPRLANVRAGKGWEIRAETLQHRLWAKYLAIVCAVSTPGQVRATQLQQYFPAASRPHAMSLQGIKNSAAALAVRKLLEGKQEFAAAEREAARKAAEVRQMSLQMVADMNVERVKSMKAAELAALSPKQVPPLP